MNCANSFCFHLYLMLHVCAARFDLTGNLEKFCELNKAFAYCCVRPFFFPPRTCVATAVDARSWYIPASRPSSPTLPTHMSTTRACASRGHRPHHHDIASPAGLERGSEIQWQWSGARGMLHGNHDVLRLLVLRACMRDVTFWTYGETLFIHPKPFEFDYYTYKICFLNYIVISYLLYLYI